MRALAELCDSLDRHEWKRSRDAKPLFNGIRTKNLQAERAGDHGLMKQYGFEEICAKSLFNLRTSNGVYDPDSPSYIVPLALDLGRSLDTRHTRC